jgi:D-glycero-D-manno-heptose 1,7-bisphosphate phosphatase
MRRAIFLDRDGVINRAVVRAGHPYPPASMAEMEILPGVPEALERLRKIGYLLIVVTNQPDVARGTMSRSVVEEMNGYLASCLPIDEFRTCFHDTVDHCSCRKPSPGSLLDAAVLHGIDLKESFMIGDRWRDVEAGKRAGCQTIFVDCGYAERQPDQFDYRVGSLPEAVSIVLGGGK